MVSLEPTKKLCDTWLNAAGRMQKSAEFASLCKHSSHLSKVNRAVVAVLRATFTSSSSLGLLVLESLSPIIESNSALFQILLQSLNTFVASPPHHGAMAAHLWKSFFDALSSLLCVQMTLLASLDDSSNYFVYSVL
jgi:hypothetical protein